MINILTLYRIFLVALICLTSEGCKKFLDVGDPPDKVAADFVYSSNASAAGVLTGILFDMQREGDGFAQGRTGISLYCGLAADEFNVVQYSAFSDMYTNTFPYDYWSTFYKFIYRLNVAIEGITASKSLSLEVSERLLGEAFFLRGFIYFYLTNLYGDVPLLLTGDYKLNSKFPRSGVEMVYNQIINDLLAAEKMLSTEYLQANLQSETFDRIRPNKSSAAALLARVYLYKRDWINAELKSTEVLNAKSYYDTTELKDVFLKNSKEAIWQFQPVSDGVLLNTLDAEMFTLIGGKPDDYFNPVWISSFLDSAFENGDARKSNWLGLANDTINGKSYLYISKYKSYSRDDLSTEYLTVLRIAEQYLIRAEARAELNKLQSAKSDLDIIRNRAGLKGAQFSSKQDLLELIFHERQVELFSEWGHRWFDLKRTGKIDQVMHIVGLSKGAMWESYKQLFPIPLQDLKYNANLVQNKGYPAN